jgi:DNA-binding transcriptional regulator YiaG
MAKELLPVVLRLKAWRAQNDISQAEAAELLCRRGLPIRLRTLQAWEAGRSAKGISNSAVSRGTTLALRSTH